MVERFGLWYMLILGTCLDPLDHSPGSRPNSSNEPSSILRDWRSVGTLQSTLETCNSDPMRIARWFVEDSSSSANQTSPCRMLSNTNRGHLLYVRANRANIYGYASEELQKVQVLGRSFNVSVSCNRQVLPVGGCSSLWPVMILGPGRLTGPIAF